MTGNNQKDQNMTKKSVALVASQYRVPFVLLTSLFFLWGFAHAILDVLNKHFQELLAITRAHSALIQATMYMGIFCNGYPSRNVYHPLGISPGSGLWLAAVWNWISVVHSGAVHDVVQYVPLLSVWSSAADWCFWKLQRIPM